MSRTQSGGGNSEGPFDGVPSSSQVSDDHGQVEAYPGHIFKQDVSGTDFLDDTVRLGPKVALVINSEALPGETPPLAWWAERDDIHAATPREAVEGPHIIPNRERREVTLFLAP
jgi:hypothetical protein